MRILCGYLVRKKHAALEEKTGEGRKIPSWLDQNINNGKAAPSHTYKETRTNDVLCHFELIIIMAGLRCECHHYMSCHFDCWLFSFAPSLSFYFFYFLYTFFCFYQSEQRVGMEMINNMLSICFHDHFPGTRDNTRLFLWKCRRALLALIHGLFWFY